MSYVEKALQRVNELIEQCKEGSEEHTDYVVMKQALGKQIPKKVLAKQFNGLVGFCPSCKVTVENGMEKFNYCPDCGQKLNREDEK